MKTAYSILLIFFLSFAYTGYSQSAKEYFDLGFAKGELKEVLGSTDAKPEPLI